jgi:hypothetical protein
MANGRKPVSIVGQVSRVKDAIRYIVTAPVKHIRTRNTNISSQILRKEIIPAPPEP